MVVFTGGSFRKGVRVPIGVPEEGFGSGSGTLVLVPVFGTVVLGSSVQGTSAKTTLLEITLSCEPPKYGLEKKFLHKETRCSSVRE